MLTVKEFKKLLVKKNSPEWLHVAMDADNKTQFYIVGNGGMGNTISMPLERYGSEIEACVFAMLSSGELVIDDKRSLLLDRNILVHYISIPDKSDMTNTSTNNFEGD